MLEKVHSTTQLIGNLFSQKVTKIALRIKHKRFKDLKDPLTITLLMLSK